MPNAQKLRDLTDARNEEMYQRELGLFRSFVEGLESDEAAIVLGTATYDQNAGQLFNPIWSLSLEDAARMVETIREEGSLLDFDVDFKAGSLYTSINVSW